MPKSFFEEQTMNNKAKYALSFFCHGGGWVMANRNKAEGVLSRYALETNSIITYADYRLAPEFKHPTASNDCYDCFKVASFVSVCLFSSTFSIITKSFTSTETTLRCLEIVLVDRLVVPLFKWLWKNMEGIFSRSSFVFVLSA